MRPSAAAGGVGGIAAAVPHEARIHGVDLGGMPAKGEDKDSLTVASPGAVRRLAGEGGG